MNVWDEWVRIHGYADWKPEEFQDFYLMLNGCESLWMEGYYAADGKA